MASNLLSAAVLFRMRRVQLPRDMCRFQLSFLEKAVLQCRHSNPARDGGGGGGGGTSDYKNERTNESFNNVIYNNNIRIRVFLKLLTQKKSKSKYAIDKDFPCEPHPGLSPTLSQSGAGVVVGGGANGGKASPYGGMEANPAIPPPLRGETGPLASSA